MSLAQVEHAFRELRQKFDAAWTNPKGHGWADIVPLKEAVDALAVAIQRERERQKAENDLAAHGRRNDTQRALSALVDRVEALERVTKPKTKSKRRRYPPRGKMGKPRRDSGVSK